MTKILDAIGDVFVSVLSFFMNLSVSRYDHPEIAEYKRRQIACLAWTVVSAVVLVAGIVVANLLNSFPERAPITAVFDGLRTLVSYGFLAAFIVSGAITIHSYYALWRFLSDSGALDQ